MENSWQKAREKVKETEDADALERELEEERKKNIALTTENEMLRGLLEEKEEEIVKLEEEKDAEIDLMDGRSYKPEAVKYGWDLLDNNVAHDKVPSVMKSVWKLIPIFCRLEVIDCHFVHIVVLVFTLMSCSLVLGLFHTLSLFS